MSQGLIAGPTRWVLFLASSQQAEDRHVLDLAYGVYCLEQAGVSAADISVYVDGPDRAAIATQWSQGTASAIPIQESHEFFVDIGNEKAENLVMFVTGHGGWEGIDAPRPIKPFPFVTAIKSAPLLKHAVVYLGQCYAGIFNYVSAGKGKGASGEADVIVIGATNLHSSISASTTETLINGPVPWFANVFLIHVFKWILSPVDVDGDGRYTVMDSFKYASALSNDGNLTMKTQVTNRIFDLRTAWLTAQAAQQSTPSLSLQMAEAAAKAQYFDALQLNHVHQDGWILNAWPAQQVAFR